jgi:integrase
VRGFSGLEPHMSLKLLAIPPSDDKNCLSVRGVIESGCKPLIGTRLKRSGMFWTVRGANTIIACRRVFIRDRAPRREFAGSQSICTVVRGALDRARVESARKGAHLFRHSLATSMIRQGASLDEIGELLCHRSPNTTAIYAKVDLPALRPLALPWPGGIR